MASHPSCFWQPFGMLLQSNSNRNIIGRQIFKGPATSAYKTLGVAVLMQSGVQDNILAPRMQYSGLIDTRISDVSGNGTNLLDGISLLSNGTPWNCGGVSRWISPPTSRLPSATASNHRLGP
jgi:hypothetical protein